MVEEPGADVELPDKTEIRARSASEGQQPAYPSVALRHRKPAPAGSVVGRLKALGRAGPPGKFGHHRGLRAARLWSADPATHFSFTARQPTRKPIWSARRPGAPG